MVLCPSREEMDVASMDSESCALLKIVLVRIIQYIFFVWVAIITSSVVLYRGIPWTIILSTNRWIDLGHWLFPMYEGGTSGCNWILKEVKQPTLVNVVIGRGYHLSGLLWEPIQPQGDMLVWPEVCELWRWGGATTCFRASYNIRVRSQSMNLRAFHHHT